eukprot:GHVN01062305.1.p1 GENE.GHVN01062305.1~~GHVN01062305.1.p1  ORF type:complete len:103 (-),score=16.00 GHVN01062305.1:132-440(-)
MAAVDTFISLRNPMDSFLKERRRAFITLFDIFSVEVRVRLGSSRIAFKLALFMEVNLFSYCLGESVDVELGKNFNLRLRLYCLYWMLAQLCDSGEERVPVGG